MSEEKPRVVEAEVVRDAHPHDVEHVSVSRVQSSRWFRKMLPPEHEQDEGRKGLRDMRFRLWIWLVGLLAVAGGCFYGAAASDVVIWSAFLLVAGAACALGAAAVAALIWAFHRLLPK
jgi:hypothetical protein